METKVLSAEDAERCRQPLLQVSPLLLNILKLRRRRQRNKLLIAVEPKVRRVCRLPVLSCPFGELTGRRESRGGLGEGGSVGSHGGIDEGSEGGVGGWEGAGVDARVGGSANKAGEGGSGRKEREKSARGRRVRELNKMRAGKTKCVRSGW